MKHAMKPWLGLVLGLIPGMLGCSGETPLTSSLQADQRPQAVAMGYDSLTGEARNVCVEAPSQKTVLNRVEPLVIAAVKNFDDIAAAISTNPAELYADPANSPLAAWARSLDQNPRMMTILIRQQRSLSSTKLSAAPRLPPSLLPGLAEAAGVDEASYMDFVASCGDQFVEEIKTGDALYALATVVLGQNEDVETRLGELSNLWQNPKDLQWALRKMPLKGVQFLYQGRDSIIATATYQSGSGLENFIKLYNEMVDGTRLITTDTAVPVERVYRPYLSSLAAELPNLGRDIYVSKSQKIPALRSQLTRSESCSTRLANKLDRPYEFTLAHPRDAEDRMALEASLQTTRSMIGSCLTSLNELNSSAACEVLPDPTLDPALFQESCKDANFQLKYTSSRLYADYLNNAEYRKILGRPLDVSRVEGYNMVQPYEKGYMVHGNYMYYTTTFAMPTKIYDTWKAKEETYGRPTATPFQKYATHDLYRFNFGKFYVTNPGTTTQKIIIVEKLAAAVPDDAAPNASESSGDTDYGKYFQVVTKDFEYYLTETRILNKVTLSEPHKISVRDAFAAKVPYKFENKFYIPIENPVNEPRARNQDRYLKLNGGYYLWMNSKGTFLVPSEIHKDYLANGGSRVLGSFKGSFTNYRDGNSLVTSIQTEEGTIRAYPLGGYQCNKPIEVLTDKMLCRPFPI
jgi:hypothetical protein